MEDILEIYLIVGVLPLLSDLWAPSLPLELWVGLMDRAPSLEGFESVVHGCSKDDGLGLV